MTNQLRIPAEWENQQAVQLTWPHVNSDWQPWIVEIEQVFDQLVKAISRYQSVIIACHPSRFNSLQTQFSDNQKVEVYSVKSDDTWARDHGPISQYHSGKLRLLNFRFNGWGSKYGANLDDKITSELAQQNAFTGTQILDQNWILEGGSIESDGQGSCLTTSRCLLNPNRNHQLSQLDIEQKLANIGFNRILWLSEGYLTGDDTDAHIDTLARFCSPDTIAYVQCRDKSDEHYQPLQAMEQQLQQFRQSNGEPYRLVPLPLPDPCINQNGERLPATYANFLIINNAVLVPTYGVRQDATALKILQRTFNNRDIIAINCRTVIEQFGSLHCLTMQIHSPTSSDQTPVNNSESYEI